MRYARKVRAVSAALAVAVVATLAPAIAAPAVANAGDIPSFCPTGTVRAETFGGDDFNPDSARGMGTWTSDPEGAFAPVQDDSGDWLLRGGPAESKSQSSARAGNEILVPQGGHVFLALDHEISGTNLYTAMWAFLDGPQTDDFAPFNDATSDRVFDGNRSRGTSYADLSDWRGQRVNMSFIIQKGGSSDYYTQWDIHDLSFVACYDDEVSAPENVRAKPRLRNATVSWDPPVQHADQVSEYQVHLYNLADRSKDRSVTVGSDRRSHKFRCLIRGHTYQAAVAVGSRVSTDPRKLFRSKVRFGSKMRRVVQFPSQTPFKGRVYCPTGNDYTKVEVLLRKKKANTRWRTARKTESYLRDGKPRWSTYLRPARNMRVRAVYRGGTYDTWWNGERVEQCMGNRTNFNAVIRVRPKIKLLTNGGDYVNHYGALRGERVHLSGKVKPYNAGRIVKLQRYKGGKWRVVKRKRLNKKSRFHFWVRHYSFGKYRYRVVTPKHKLNAWGRSDPATIKVYA